MREIIDDLYRILVETQSHEAVPKLVNRIGYWETKEDRATVLEALCYLLLTEHLKARYASAKCEVFEKGGVNHEDSRT